MDRKAARAVRRDLHKTIKNVFSNTFLERSRRIFIIQNGIVLCAHWSGQTSHFHRRHDIYNNIIVLLQCSTLCTGIRLRRVNTTRTESSGFFFVPRVYFFFTQNRTDSNESKSRVRRPPPHYENKSTIFHRRVSVTRRQILKRRRSNKLTPKFRWTASRAQLASAIITFYVILCVLKKKR